MSSLYIRHDLEPESLLIGGEVTLSGPEAKHAVTVSRTRAGERLAIGNGRGLMVAGPVIRAAGAELAIEVDALDVAPAPAQRIVLAQALAKGDRDELAVQAATELGIDAVIPWAADRSVSRWEGAKAAKGRERWSTIAREAAKQSIRSWLPEVGELATTKELAGLTQTHRLLVLEPTATTRLSSMQFDTEPSDPRPLVLVVGPEGGISPAELDRLDTAGAEMVRLGETVLRTSTAGPAALAVLNGILGRW
ncbi:MAG: rRNA (uracil1498-N3)-methyltransferase [Microbacteriaceae bacterium]|nr:rRNA (uracil1498-N3)-methyltransferase [Microbacteriaceae bacterium]